MSQASYAEFDGQSTGRVTGLQPSTHYYFRVAAIHPDTRAKASDYTQVPYPEVSTRAEAAGGYDVAIPTGFRSTSQTTTSLTLDWDDAPGAEAYRVQISPNASMSGARYAEFDTSTGVISGLSEGTQYWFRVAAIDPVTRAKASDYTQVPYPTVSTALPGYTFGVPTGLTSTSHSTSSIDLDWNDVVGAQMYRVQLSKSSSMSGAEYYRFTKSTGSIDQLSAGTRYYFRVAVIDPDSGAKLSDYTQTPYPSVATSGGSSARNSVTVPDSRTIAFKGHGYGHGIGMGQYGAEGGARSGASYTQILAHYYPGTTMGTKSGNIRVLLSSDTTDSVMIEAKSGLTFRPLSGGSAISLPTTVGGKTVIRWSIDPLSTDKRKSVLRYRTDPTWRVYNNTTWTGDAQFEGSTMDLVLPEGGDKTYRTTLRSALPKSGATNRDTVNVLSIEHYTRGVVPRESPSSWHAEALKAQAVAARTYGVRSITSSRYYDICDTTSCQVYGGADAEVASTNDAVSATAGKILTYDGAPAFTQFSSSSGGFTNAGSQPYLRAVDDPWDDWSGNANHDWTINVKASTIESHYASIGTLRSMEVTKRNGHGDMGGRVSSLKLVGSKASVTISGVDARFAFGLRSDWFGF
jgi:SpoIID/LytB domain protein